MRCCGHELTTCFCPHCGASNDRPLVEMAGYLRGKINVLEATYERCVDWDKANPEKAAGRYRQEKRKNLRTKIEKYKRWIIVLEELDSKRLNSPRGD